MFDDKTLKACMKVHSDELVKLVKQLHTAPARGGWNSMLGRKTEGQFEIKRKISSCIKVMNELKVVAVDGKLDDDSELELQLVGQRSEELVANSAKVSGCGEPGNRIHQVVLLLYLLCVCV